jgi:hypothetical protein
MIQYRKTWQNTARIARTVLNVAVCRAFLRATLREVIDRQWIVIDRSSKNRPPTDRVGIRCLAGISSSI